MFLAKLSLTKRNAFLDAALRIATADGQYSKGELDFITSACDEMGIKYRKEIKLSYDAAVIELNAGSTPEVKKQLLFELVGIAYADNVIQPREEQMIKFAMDVFKISKLDYDKIVALVKDLAKVRRAINDYLKK